MQPASAAHSVFSSTGALAQPRKTNNANAFAALLATSSAQEQSDSAKTTASAVSAGQVNRLEISAHASQGIQKNNWNFPPATAPESVQQAWQKTTNFLGKADAVELQIHLSLQLTHDNIINGTNGEGVDYNKLVRDMLDGANFSKKYDQPWQHEYRANQIAGLEKFLNNLQST